MAKITINVDSSQLAAFHTCPRYWHYAYVKRLSSIQAPPSDAMMMGTFGHGMLDVYYKEIATSGNKLRATDMAMAWEPEKEPKILCKHCGKVKTEHFEAIGGEVLACKEPLGKVWEPVPFPLSQVNRNIVKKRFIDYSVTYITNDVVPVSPEHVEVGFTEQIYEDENFLFTLEGRMDLIGKFANTDVIMDHKFQIRAHDLNIRSIQFKNYAMVGGVPTFIVNYIRLTKEISNTTLHRVPIGFSKPYLDTWKKYLIGSFKRMAKAIEAADADPHYWLKSTSEPNWAACDGRWGYTCEYQPICDEPGMAENREKMLYHIKEEWKPW